MRQSQQKNRMRGRGRKMPNPMSRNYESNGPDVKIRGNAAHIAEKYASLARDAFASGDTVMGENYLQHAEHYNRIVMAAQAQMQAFRQDDQPIGGFGGAAPGRGPQPEVGGYGEGEEEGTEAAAPQEADGSFDDLVPPAVGGEPNQFSGQPGQPNRGGNVNGQAEFGGRHHRNRRRPRFGENGRDNGYRDRQPREGGQNAAPAGGPAAEPAGTAAERRGGVSQDASMLPQSILGGGPLPDSNGDE